MNAAVACGMCVGLDDGERRRILSRQAGGAQGVVDAAD
jgi:hypothetical protein